MKQFHRIYLGLFFAILTLSACLKKDEPLVLPITQGEAKLVSFSLGKDYTTQLYFQLSDQTYKTNGFEEWDLAFGSGEKSEILMNGGKDVQVLNTNDTCFGNIDELPTQPKWLFDNPSGIKSLHAFYGWYDTIRHCSNNSVYILDRGPMEQQRYKKIVILGVTPFHYLIKYANLDGSGFCLVLVQKDPRKSYTRLLLNDVPKVLNTEPEKREWDLLFTRYRHVYYDMEPITPYAVTGVLLNPNLVAAAKDSTMGFANIDLAYAKTVALYNQTDVIGFDWKRYDFNLGRYEVNRKYCYIIKDTKGVYYKLRFTDFYSDQGVKGNPKFEIKKL